MKKLMNLRKDKAGETRGWFEMKEVRKPVDLIKDKAVETRCWFVKRKKKVNKWWIYKKKKNKKVRKVVDLKRDKRRWKNVWIYKKNEVKDEVDERSDEFVRRKRVKYKMK